MLAATLFAKYKCIGGEMLLGALHPTNKCVGGQMLIKIIHNQKINSRGAFLKCTSML